MSLALGFSARAIVAAVLGVGVIGALWWYEGSRLYPYQTGVVWHFHAHHEAMDRLATELERSSESAHFACFPEQGRLTLVDPNVSDPTASIDPRRVEAMNALCVDSGLMLGSRFKDGVIFPVGTDRKWGREIWISYARLSQPQPTPVCDAAVTRASSGDGFCDVPLDAHWVIHYQWFAPHGT